MEPVASLRALNQTNGSLHTDGHVSRWQTCHVTNACHSHKQSRGRKKGPSWRNANNRPQHGNADGHGNIRLLCVSYTQKQKHICCLCGSLSTAFRLPFRAHQNLTNSTDAKTKMLMEKMVNLPRLHLLLNLHPPPSYLPTCAAFLACWRAGYSENIEWKAFSIQPVSQSPRERGFGWGEQPGFRLWSPGVMTEPRAEKSGVSSTGLLFFVYFYSKSYSFHSAVYTLFQAYSVFIQIYSFSNIDTSLGVSLGLWNVIIQSVPINVLFATFR